MLDYSKNARGFVVGDFKDLYNVECSIQDSSLATEAAIWLGVNDASPKIMASQAKNFGIKTSETCGWIPYPIPEEVLMTTRMHLNIDQAKELIKVLQRFVDSESIYEIVELTPTPPSEVSDG